MRHSRQTEVLALTFSVAILVLGYVTLGVLPTFLFAFGFMGGWVAWLLFPRQSTWEDIRVPFYIALALFVVHRVEERVTGFFPTLSAITGEPTPPLMSPAVIALVITSVGAWLATPFLMATQHPIGRYLAWTFFVSMGVTELAHFVLPIIAQRGWGYFPGMASVVALAPVAWWGMRRLARRAG